LLGVFLGRPLRVVTYDARFDATGGDKTEIQHVNVWSVGRQDSLSGREQSLWIHPETLSYQPLLCGDVVLSVCNLLGEGVVVDIMSRASDEGPSTYVVRFRDGGEICHLHHQCLIYRTHAVPI
jgi:hypothetical protein